MIDRRDTNPRRETTDRRSSDRREDPRVSPVGQIRFLRSGETVEAVLHGELLDVSQSGIQMLFDEELKDSEKLLIEVRDAEDRCFNLTAKVVWCESMENDNRFRVGCELSIELTRTQYALLRRMSVRASADAASK